MNERSLHLTRWCGAIAIALLLGVVLHGVGTVRADTPPRIEPANVEVTISPAGSVQINKVVHTPEVPPMFDVCLVEDETGSFGDDIATLQTLAGPGGPLITALDGTGADYASCVIGFRDFAQDGWGSAGDWVYRRLADVAVGGAGFVAGVPALTAGGGNDGPEAQLEALHYLADGTHAAIDSNGDADTTDANDTAAGQQPSWRVDSQRFVLLTTDAACHVQGDAGGWPGDAGTASEAATAAALSTAGITVIGLVPGGAGAIACVDALAAATGGSVQDTGANGEDIVAAIISGLEAVNLDVAMATDCADTISVSFDPASQTVASGGDAQFVETISVAAGAAPGTYECDDWATINGVPMTDEGGNLIVEHKVIHVIDGRMTGGGSVFAAGGGAAVRVTHGFELHCDVTDLPNRLQVNWGGHRFHLTSLDTAVCVDQAGISEAPPLAGFDTHRGRGTGRYDGVPGATAVWTLVDAGEPGTSDTLRLTIWDAAANVVLSVSGSLDHGNHQAHAP